MSHSPEFNARRRAAYRAGRRAGLTPREAGHLYWASPVEGRMMPEAKTLARIRDRNAAMNPTRVLAPHPTRGYSQDFYGTYTKVRIYTEDSEGKRHSYFLTVATGKSEPLSRQRILDTAEQIMARAREKGIDSGHGQTVMGFTIMDTEVNPR